MLHRFGDLEQLLSDWNQARALYERALQEPEHKAESDQKEWVIVLHNIASIDIYEGAYETARKTYLKGLTIMQKIGDRAGEATIWHQLATVNNYEKDDRAAAIKLNEALNIAQEIGGCAYQCNRTSKGLIT